MERMATAIAHRGPDAGSYFETGRVSLGHRRLSIIDLETGHQPMANEDGTITAVYNGEIFNHASLRPALEAVGHRYATHCDTETILHSYEEYGPQCLDRFRGMFAFALWDSTKQRLFAARDRLGIKPFYYYWDGHQFVFASEIKALLEHPAIRPEFNRGRLGEYLALGYGSSQETLFTGIGKLEPGHWLELRLDGPEPRLHIERYWDVPRPETMTASDVELIAECRRRLEETVQMRLMSDVPLGTFLSGGVDSSAITALASQMAPGRMKTFAVGYADQRYSELGYARQVANYLGTEHHEIQIGMPDFFGALPQLTWHEDEPISWPSSISLYYVSQLAAQQVKVVLTGEGSDELFAGYERYSHYLFNSRWMERYRMVPESIRRGIQEFVESSPLLRADLRRKIGHTFLGRADRFESLQLENFYCSFPAAELRAAGWHGTDQDLYGPYLGYWNAAASWPTVERMLYADRKTYLVELLMKQDQMSMASSIESRVPFLDHTYVEWATHLPATVKIRDGEAKWILKKAVEDLLPADIIYRRKMGFPTPLKSWLLSPEAAGLYEYLLEENGFLAGFLNLGWLQGLLDQHRSGSVDATDRIWRLLTVQVWGDWYFTGRKGTIEQGLPGFPRS